MPASPPPSQPEPATSPPPHPAIACGCLPKLGSPIRTPDPRHRLRLMPQRPQPGPKPPPLRRRTDQPQPLEPPVQKPVTQLQVKAWLNVSTRCLLRPHRRMIRHQSRITRRNDSDPLRHRLRKPLRPNIHQVTATPGNGARTDTKARPTCPAPQTQTCRSASATGSTNQPETSPETGFTPCPRAAASTLHRQRYLPDATRHHTATASGTASNTSVHSTTAPPQHCPRLGPRATRLTRGATVLLSPPGRGPGRGATPTTRAPSKPPQAPTPRRQSSPTARPQEPASTPRPRAGRPLDRGNHHPGHRPMRLQSRHQSRKVKHGLRPSARPSAPAPPSRGHPSWDRPTHPRKPPPHPTAHTKPKSPA